MQVMQPVQHIKFVQHKAQEVRPEYIAERTAIPVDVYVDCLNRPRLNRPPGKSWRRGLLTV